MDVTINGKTKSFEASCSITAMLETLDLHPQRVAVELNREIIKRDRYDEVTVSDGDEVEILQFVGGGA